MMRVTPYGVQNRFRQVLKRRQYSVPIPNSLWHLDGNHKLIRWRIVVHGGIDGYCRLPIFIKASNNNRANTVLQCFLNAVECMVCHLGYKRTKVEKTLQCLGTCYYIPTEDQVVEAA